MKTKISCLSFALFSFILSSCSTLKSPFFYEAKKDDKRILLFGTLHRGVSFKDVPNEIISEMKQSDIVYFEIDMAKEFDKKSVNYQADREARDSREFMRTEKELPLDQLLGETLWRRFVYRFSKEFTEKQMKNFTPYLGYQLTIEGETVEVNRFQAAAFDPKNGIDLNLSKIAEEEGKKIYGLETVKEVDELCRSENNHYYLSLLKERLEGRDSSDLMFELADAYRKGDEATIEKLLASSYEEACILKDRNIKWVEKLANQFKFALFPQKQMFVAVGAAHLLPGKYPSVLDLLGQKGFTIRKISLK